MKLELTVPTSWEDITVGKFVELYPVLTMDGNLFERVPALIACLTNTPLDDILKLKREHYKVIGDKINFLYDWEKLDGVKEHIWLDGHRYSIDVNLKNSTGGQYMSVMQLLKGTNNEDGTINYDELFRKLHLILACFIFKDKKVIKRRRFRGDVTTYERGEFDSIEYDEVAKLIRDKMSIADAFPMAVFFYHFTAIAIETIKEYSRQQTETAEVILSEVQADLEKHGVGI